MAEMSTSKTAAGTAPVQPGQKLVRQMPGSRHVLMLGIRRYAVLIMIFAVGLFLSIESQSFLQPTNLMNIFNENAYLLIMAGALTLVIISGGFDLSTGAMFAMSGVAAAWCVRNPNLQQVFGTGACLLIGPLVGLCLGLVNGVVITSLRIHSFLATPCDQLDLSRPGEGVGGG